MSVAPVHELERLRASLLSVVGADGVRATERAIDALRSGDLAEAARELIAVIESIEPVYADEEDD